MYLESNDHSYGRPQLQSGQMRMGFVSGGPTKMNVLKGGILLADKEPARSVRQCSFTNKNVDNWSDDFHEYGLLWRPGILLEVFCFDAALMQLKGFIIKLKLINTLKR